MPAPGRIHPGDGLSPHMRCGYCIGGLCPVHRDRASAYMMRRRAGRSQCSGKPRVGSVASDCARRGKRALAAAPLVREQTLVVEGISMIRNSEPSTGYAGVCLDRWDPINSPGRGQLPGSQRENSVRARRCSLWPLVVGGTVDPNATVRANRIGRARS